MAVAAARLRRGRGGSRGGGRGGGCGGTGAACGSLEKIGRFRRFGCFRRFRPFSAVFGRFRASWGTGWPSKGELYLIGEFVILCAGRGFFPASGFEFILERFWSFWGVLKRFLMFSDVFS